jgi:hypothetical protein
MAASKQVSSVIRTMQDKIKPKKKQSPHTAGAAVLKLHVQLGKCVAFENRSISHITLAACLDNVPHLEALDGLILGNTSSTVCASNDRSVATTLLAATIITSLLRHPVQMTMSWIS